MQVEDTLLLMDERLLDSKVALAGVTSTTLGSSLLAHNGCLEVFALERSRCIVIHLREHLRGQLLVHTAPSDSTEDSKRSECQTKDQQQAEKDPFHDVSQGKWSKNIINLTLSPFRLTLDESQREELTEF